MNPIEKMLGIDPWAVLGLVMAIGLLVLLVIAHIEERKEKRRKERREMGLPDESTNLY